MRKTTFCIFENKGVADERLCFRYMNNTILMQNIQHLAIFCACTVGLCQTCLEITLLVFLMMRLITGSIKLDPKSMFHYKILCLCSTADLCITRKTITCATCYIRPCFILVNANIEWPIKHAFSCIYV